MSTLKNFWLKHESKIVLAVGFILIAAISFEAGLMKGREIKQNPLVIEKPVLTESANNSSPAMAPEIQNTSVEIKSAPNEANSPSEECVYVGSKNSNKYHRPTCSFAKRIKPENKVCFSSAEDAAQKGYLPDSSCIK